MKKILNIANGDVAIGIMKKANISGEFLAWRDFLHEGAVPPNLSLEELSRIRTIFIEKQGFGELETIHQSFKARDNKLKSSNEYDKVILWFEHDLYDQLQLIQLLAWFEEHPLESTILSLICIDSYLGETEIYQVQNLLLYEEAVSHQQLLLAKEAWNAFRSPTPQAWFKLLNKDTSTLSFLKDAIHRMLEEYPNSHNGLSRTEHQALFCIAQGEHQPQKIFTACQNAEERKFMGDVIFGKILEDFIAFKLINAQKNNQDLRITVLGRMVLQGDKNWLQIKPIKRWIGGVYIHKNNLWCWNTTTQTIAKYYYSTSLSSLLVMK